MNPNKERYEKALTEMKEVLDKYGLRLGGSCGCCMETIYVALDGYKTSMDLDLENMKVYRY